MSQYSQSPDLVREIQAMGQRIAALEHQQIGRFLDPVIARLAGGTASALDNTSTAINFATVEVDTAGMFDGLQPDRLTVRRAGVYVVAAKVGVAANSSGVRGASIAISATTPAEVTLPPTVGAAWETTVTAIVPLEKGDTVRVFCFQTSGGTLAASGTLAAAWLGVGTG